MDTTTTYRELFSAKPVTAGVCFALGILQSAHIRRQIASGVPRDRLDTTLTLTERETFAQFVAGYLFLAGALDVFGGEPVRGFLPSGYLVEEFTRAFNDTLSLGEDAVLALFENLPHGEG